MNKQRREYLANARDRLEGIKSDIETARDEEQDFLDSMPQSMQDGAKGENAAGAIEAMEEAIENLESAITNLETAEA